jgi:phosphoglycolate phosphatase-like HAD superfamily hydrolase
MNPDLLALDFDGVLCDGLLEYFAVARQTHQQLWQRTEPIAPEIADRFYPLRPVIETGWEMPVLIQALVEGRSPEEIEQNWRSIAAEIIQRDRLEPAQLSQQLDGNRDRWIADDLDGWLDLHRFFPGTIERLQQVLASAETELVIITTKEERFVRQLLDRAGVDHQAIAIFGKATQRPKAETLKQWLGQKSRIWFVEDMLSTLHKVAREPMLDRVQLFLADWGYNTAGDRASISGSDRIQLLSLDRFAQPFGNWLAP